MEKNRKEPYAVELWHDITDGFKEIPKSVLFWNGLALVGFIALFFINFEIFLVAQAFASFIALGYLMDGDVDEKGLWITFTALFWFMIAFMLVAGGLGFLYEHSIAKFNDWLNKQKERPLTRAEKKELWKQQHIQKKKSKRLSEKQ